MVIIHVVHDDLIKFWVDNADKLIDNYLLLAEDTDQNTQLYMSDDEKSTALTVWVNGAVKVTRNIQVLDNKTGGVADQLLEAYDQLLAEFIDKDEEEEEYTDLSHIIPYYDFLDIEDRVRLSNLRDAALEFLDVLIEGDAEKSGIDDVFIDEMISAVEEHLSELGLFCWHPTPLENGVVIEFPFDDEEWIHAEKFEGVEDPDIPPEEGEQYEK